MSRSIHSLQLPPPPGPTTVEHRRGGARVTPARQVRAQHAHCDTRQYATYTRMRRTLIVLFHQTIIRRLIPCLLFRGLCIRLIVPMNVPLSECGACLFVFEDNEAVIVMAIKGRTPNTRVDVDRLFGRIAARPTISLR